MQTAPAAARGEAGARAGAVATGAAGGKAGAAAAAAMAAVGTAAARPLEVILSATPAMEAGSKLPTACTAAEPVQYGISPLQAVQPGQVHDDAAPCLTSPAQAATSDACAGAETASVARRQPAAATGQPSQQAQAAVLKSPEVVNPFERRRQQAQMTVMTGSGGGGSGSGGVEVSSSSASRLLGRGRGSLLSAKSAAGAGGSGSGSAPGIASTVAGAAPSVNAVLSPRDTAARPGAAAGAGAGVVQGTARLSWLKSPKAGVLNLAARFAPRPTVNASTGLGSGGLLSPGRGGAVQSNTLLTGLPADVFTIQRSLAPLPPKSERKGRGPPAEVSEQA